MNKKIEKAKILLKQNWLAISILILWFIVHLIVFYILTGGNFTEALEYTFYFKETETGYGHFYPIMSGFLIFGLILTLLTIELYRKYNPIQTCLALSRSMKNHTIIIGYSHLGQRIRAYLKKRKEKYVVIEDDRTLINDLIEKEEPIIPKKAHDASVLEAANIREAKLVLTTKNDLETLVVATNLVRDVNKHCKVVCRCFNDSLAEILEKKINCETISTSKYVCEFIIKEIEQWNVNNILVIGCTNTTRRLIKIFRAKNLVYHIIELNEDKVADIIDEEPITIGDAKDKDILQAVGISQKDLVIVLIDAVEEVLIIADLIRDLNENCHLICRFYHEEVTEILEKPPFNAMVLSTSKHALEKLIEKGIFSS